MNITQKRRFNKLIRFLTNLNPLQFDITNWVTHSSKINGHACGTVCCAIGWFPKLFPTYFSWSKCGTYVINPKSGNLVTYNASADFLGITCAESERLFSIETNPRNITPQQVAKNCQHLLDGYANA